MIIITGRQLAQFRRMQRQGGGGAFSKQPINYSSNSRPPLSTTFFYYHPIIQSSSDHPIIRTSYDQLLLLIPQQTTFVHHISLVSSSSCADFQHESSKHFQIWKFCHISHNTHPTDHLCPPHLSSSSPSLTIILYHIKLLQFSHLYRDIDITDILWGGNTEGWSNPFVKSAFSPSPQNAIDQICFFSPPQNAIWRRCALSISVLHLLSQPLSIVLNIWKQSFQRACFKLGLCNFTMWIFKAFSDLTIL